MPADLAADWLDGVLFDMDGTLVHSAPALIKAWTQWAIEHDVTAEQLADRHGTPTAEIVADLFSPADVPAALARINQLEETVLDGVEPLPGAVESLHALRDVPTAIVTSSTAEVCRRRLRAAGIELPDVIISYDDVERGKPAPDPFLAGARRLGLAPGRCLAVEDATLGLASAREAGCVTLGLRTQEDHPDDAADLVVDDLAQVIWQVTEGRIRVQSR